MKIDDIYVLYFNTNSEDQEDFYFGENNALEAYKNRVSNEYSYDEFFDVAYFGLCEAKVQNNGILCCGETLHNVRWEFLDYDDNDVYQIAISVNNKDEVVSIGSDLNFKETLKKIIMERSGLF